MQIKRIKCPKCDIVLDVKNSKEQASVRLHCPNCRTLLQVSFPPEEEPVEAPTFYARPKQPVDNGATQLGGGPSGGTQASASQQIVSLVFEGRGYPLEEGRNIVGRKAKKPQANVQIPTDDLYMSRQHCVINVTTMDDGRKKAVLSNFQNKNDTLINGHQIGSGDAIILQNGNMIKMGETTVMFKVQ